MQRPCRCLCIQHLPNMMIILWGKLYRKNNCLCFDAENDCVLLYYNENKIKTIPNSIQGYIIDNRIKQF